MDDEVDKMAGKKDEKNFYVFANRLFSLNWDKIGQDSEREAQKKTKLMKYINSESVGCLGIELKEMSNSLANFNDFKIICSGGISVPCLKFLLNNQSQYFNDLLTNNKNDLTELKMENFSAKIIQLIIDSLIEVKLENFKDLTWEDWNELFTTMAFFKMARLIKAISVFFEAEILKIDKAFEFFDLAKKIDCTELQRKCAYHLWRNLENVSIESLSKLSKDDLMEIFVLDHLFNFMICRYDQLPDLIDLTNRHIKILYEVLKSSNRLELFEELVRNGFEEDYLYVIVTKDTKGKDLLYHHNYTIQLIKFVQFYSGKE